jgi:integrase
MVKKTKAGTYKVSFRDPTKASGAKDRRTQKTFRTLAAARAFERKVRTQIKEGEYIPPTNETVKEIAAKWHKLKVDAGTYKRSSIENWRVHIEKHINPALGNLKIRQLTVEAIEEGARKWQETTSPKTANKMLTTLTAVLDLAKRYRLIKDNPARDAERLKLATADEDSGEVTPDKVYTKAEIRKIIEATEQGSRDRVFVMILALLGLRIGEALALMWPAIDLKAGDLDVRYNLADAGKGNEPLFQAPKTKSSRRSLSLPQELIHELRVWKLKCPKSERELVFTTEEGRPIDRKSASKMLDRAIKKAELEKRLTPHGLRHTFASLLLADGVPVPEVAAYLGHKDCSITLKVYAHFVREETQAMHNLAASILAGER